VLASRRGRSEAELCGYDPGCIVRWRRGSATVCRSSWFSRFPSVEEVADLRPQSSPKG